MPKTSVNDHQEAIRLEPLMKPKTGQNGSVKASNQGGSGLDKRVLYDGRRPPSGGGGTVCTQAKALGIAAIVLAALLTAALVIAYAGPQAECPCQGERPANFPDEEAGDFVGPGTANGTPIATNNEVFPWNDVRLPPWIRPVRYELRIHPNLTTLEVKGEVWIEFQVKKEANFIVFHSNNLTITDHSLQNARGDELNMTRMLEYRKAHQVYMEIREKFKPHQNYTLSLRYNTRLSRELEGFYISSYLTPAGERRYLATTHFEPTHARSAFPCFDEPQMKARFKLSVLRDPFHIALFNMPVADTEKDGIYRGKILLRDDFQESLEMSTYLVAFIVCDYKHIRKSTNKGVSLSVYAPPHLLPQAEFALESASDIMDFYEDFFMIPYPLPKQDLITIPDFAAGAMENWGLITYRETSILYDANETSAAAREWVAVVIAHELAHQWFGNLVTMKWWNDLWLNEGLASFLEYLGVDHVQPEWRMMEQFVLDKTQPALALDALTTSHAISLAVRDPAEIESIFDTISYSKGAAIVYMMEKFLRLDNLRVGLNDYLNIHKYGNAETKDLWNVLSKHANESIEVKKIMDTWTLQMGFPLITITRDRENPFIFKAKQKRFVMSSETVVYQINMTGYSPLGYKWFVPVSYYTNLDSNTGWVWLNMTDERFKVIQDVEPTETPSTSTSSALSTEASVSFTTTAAPETRVEWIKVNVNQSGFYRVNYERVMWQALIRALRQNHTVFSAADRAGLLDDAFTLCRAGILDAFITLDLASYLINERDYVPWATALDHLHAWAKYLSESLPYKLLLSFMRHLLTPAANHVGWEDEGPHLQKLLRTEILASAILAGVDSAAVEARTRYADWMDKDNRVPPNLRDVVYFAGVKYGGEREWRHCWEKMTTSTVPSEQKLLLKALGFASDPWLLQRFLLLALDPRAVRPQDLKIVLSTVASNPEGKWLAWRHLKANWNYLQATFGNGSLSLGSLVTAVTSHFSSPHDHDEVKQFCQNSLTGSGARALAQSLETIRLNIDWVKLNEEPIYNWLTKYLKEVGVGDPAI